MIFDITNYRFGLVASLPKFKYYFYDYDYYDDYYYYYYYYYYITPLRRVETTVKPSSSPSNFKA